MHACHRHSHPVPLSGTGKKDHCMCYPVRVMVHIKEPLLLIGKSSPCGCSGFPLSLSDWSFTTYLMPYNCKCVNCIIHLPPATDSSRTVRTPLYPPVQAVPPYSPPPFIFPVPDRGAGMCARDGCATTACSDLT